MEIPDVVVARALESGREGSDWVAALPALVAELEDRWRIRVTEALAGGTGAFVTRALTEDGTTVVLKVPVPGLSDDRVVRVLTRADGAGYVRLLRHDERAMLLEHLGPSLATAGRPVREQLERLGRLLPTAWQRPGDHDTPFDKAAGLLEFVEDRVDRWEGPALERALEFARRRSAAFDPEHALVVHGDPAPANTLTVPEPRRGAELGVVFVDPDGFTGDPAYDPGVALRDWCPQLFVARDPADLLRGYCRTLATESGQDPQAVWEWGFLERVSTGLYARSLGAEDLAAPFLETAALLAPDV
ncbi:phosphotransferase [Kineococcus sp. NBC_00420]|uniref:aminoglycoside phosphotransferase family protein n=1 Tax=Kineococcus sp. NBC_00420 TaxID=2903564 RepID=UPI002E24EF5B